MNHSIAAINPGVGDKQNKASRVVKLATNKCTVRFDLVAWLVGQWEFCALSLRPGGCLLMRFISTEGNNVVLYSLSFCLPADNLVVERL